MHDISREKCNADDHSRKANKLVATAKNRSKKRLFCQMSTNSDTPTWRLPGCLVMRHFDDLRPNDDSVQFSSVQ